MEEPGSLTAATVTASEAPTALRELAVGTQVGRYQIVEVLGVGGMAVVYRARDPYLSRDVALKLLHEYRRLLPDASSDYGRLLREAQALARLSHPNVVAAFDVGSHDGAIFLAMELIEGESLRDWLRTRRPRDTILRVLLGAGRGLAAAHAAGVLHRDFKPGNVVVSPDGRAHVVDFGLAREAPDRPARPTEEAELALGSSLSNDLTQAGTVMGTPGFMAPEQASGEPADARADQFGFAATVFYALVGREPFPGKDVESYRHALVRRTRVPWHREIPARLRRVVERGLAVRAEQRWPSMEAMVDELDRAVAPPRWRLVAAGLAVAAIGGVAIAVMAPGARQPSPCAEDPGAFDQAWNPQRRAAVQAAFSAHGAAFAEDSFTRVAARLDGVRGRWVAVRHASCEATHVARTQTEQVQALRSGCLDAKRAQVATMVGLLEQADAPLVERAVASVAGIGDLAECDDVAALLGESQALPTDPARRATVQRASVAIEEAEALWRAGRWPDALAAVSSQLAILPALGHDPTEARARILAGSVLYSLGRRDEAIAELERGLALAAGAVKLRLEASSAILGLLIRDRHMPQAEAILPHVAADVRAAGRPARQELMLLTSRAAARAFAHDFAAARTYLQAAHALCDGDGATDPAFERPCLTVVQEQGLLALEEEDLAGAAATFGLLIEQMKRIDGPAHPSLVAQYINRITALSELGDRDGALAALGEARQVGTTLPKTMPHHGRLDLIEGVVWHSTGDCARAIPAYQRAIERLVTDTRNRTVAHLRLGRCLVATGETVSAVGHLELVAAQRRNEDAPALWQGEVLFELAQALWATPTSRVRARAIAREAEQLFRAAEEDGAASLIEVETWLKHRE